MPDLFDTRQIRDDVAYWDTLALRVSAEAARRAKPRGSDWLVYSRTSWIAASLLLAAALAYMALPRDRTSARSVSTEWAQALAPADDMGKAITLEDGPPEIGALLLGGRRGGVR
jgi:hypothetical protein